MANRKRTGVNLYDDVVLQYVEWNYFDKELNGVSVTAFQVLSFLYKYVLVQSRPFHPCNLPYDHFTSPAKVRNGLYELARVGLITRIKEGKYQFNEEGNTFVRSFQAMTAIRRTKLMHPLKEPLI